MEKFVESSLQKAGLQVDSASLIKHLRSLGVDDPSDVTFLTEKDLIGVLNMIQARKLLACWSPPSDSSKRYV